MSYESSFRRSVPVPDQPANQPDAGSRGNAAPNPESPPPNDQPRATVESSGRIAERVDNALVADVDKYIAAFRDGKTSKPRTIALITSRLDFKDGGGVEDAQKEAALTEYLGVIDSVERLAREAARRGAHALGRPAQPAQAPEPSRALATAVDDEIESYLESIAPSKKRAGPDGEEEEGGGNGSDGEGLSNKKQKLYERDMPWFPRELAARQHSNPSCAETRRILGLLGNDIGTVKRWIQQSSAAPPGFPSSEWENIARGNAVDLNKVFSSLHLVAPTKENVGRVGSTTISLGETEPLRRIQTSGDWFAAWREAAKATAFVFPHRHDELWDYGDYIAREFSAKMPSSHKKIILYDAAVRNMVGGGQSILLTDRHRFDHIYSAIIPADGIQSDVGRSGASASRPGSRGRGSDICKRFNGSQGCPDGNSCRFKHVCARCKKQGHGQRDCESGKEGEGKAGARASA
jgi:hypothetical protein